jgi:hypothetical protein
MIFQKVQKIVLGCIYFSSEYHFIQAGKMFQIIFGTGANVWTVPVISAESLILSVPLGHMAGIKTGS